jgi:hypothetical protein
LWITFALCVGAISTTPTQASEPVTGRWAADPSACSIVSLTAQSSLIVTDYAVRWHDDACRIARMYKTGDTVHIQADCWGNNGARSIPVSLRPHDGKLLVWWDRVASGNLQRCR